MELIILNDGTYQLIEVTKQMLSDVKLYNTNNIDCFNLCDIIRLKLTTYHEAWNIHIMNNGSGYFYGCLCK